MINSLLFITLCIVWGATWVAIKIGLSESPPFYGAAIRFLLASAILIGIVTWRRPNWPQGRALWGWTILSGILMYVGSYSVVYYVEQYINAALAAILFASFPFFMAILAHKYLPNERLTVLKIAGLVVGFGGVVVLFSGGATAPSTRAWWAPGLMILSPLCSAIATAIIKKHLTREDPFVLNVIQMSIGAVLLLALAVTLEDFAQFRWNVKAVGAVIFLGCFGSVYAFVTLYHLMKTLAASRVALIAFATPITAAILGWIMLGEVLTWATFAGAVLVLIGIYIVNVLGEKRVRPAASAAAAEAADL